MNSSIKQTNLEAHLKHNLNHIIRIARLAPSAHNAQPWSVSLNGDALVIAISQNRKLVAGDPTGRQNFIGLGIFTEAILVAAEYYGLSPEEVRVDQTLIKVRFKRKKPAKNINELIALLKKRCSDRSLYSKIDIPSSTLKGTTSAWDDRSAKILMTTEPKIIQKAADLTARGMRLALSSSAFRHELAEYLINPLSSKKTGIPIKSMRVPGFLYVLLPFFIKHNIRLKRVVHDEKKRWLSASGLVFVATAGDMPADWVTAGRAYLRASLAIEKAGLNQATSAAIVEAADFHEDVEKLLNTKLRIQCVLRIGKGDAHKIFSPRLNTKDIIT